MCRIVLLNAGAKRVAEFSFLKCDLIMCLLRISPEAVVT